MNFPLYLAAAIVLANASWVAADQVLSSKDGLSLRFGDNGRVIEVSAGKEAIIGGNPGGFYLRDAVAGGDFVSVRGKVQVNETNKETVLIDGSLERQHLNLQ